MLKMGLGIAAARRSPWWPSNAGYAADFPGFRFMRQGSEITAAEAFGFSRASAKWAMDSSGTWQNFPANAPARTDLGLLIEPAATNLVPNAALAGASAGVLGAGGTLPTGWTLSGAGLTTQIVAITTLAGLPALTLRASGTATGGFYELAMMPDASVSPSSSYCASMVMAIGEGGAPIVEVRQATSSSTFVNANTLPLGSGSGPVRAFVTFSTQATTALARLRMTRTLTIGQSYLFEVTLACPQFETGSKPTSPLLAPRSADALTLNLSALPQTLTVEHDDSSIATFTGASGSYPLVTSLPRAIIRRAVTI